jgi:acetyl/propionyl-CoA carboxylase alpha subunit
MYKNRADIQKNRLYVLFQGKMDIDEIKAGSINVLDEAKRLKPGFGIISDISGFVPTTEEGRLLIQETMKTLKDMGMKHTVRIVPVEASVVGLQWQRSSRAAGYEARQVPTLAEAEDFLDKLEQE